MSEIPSKFSDKQKAILALKSLTHKNILLMNEMEKKMYQLAEEYQEKFNQILEKQNKIINGGEVVEADFEDFLSLKKDASTEKTEYPELKYEKNSGFKNFWLIALKKEKEYREWIHPVDEPVLEYLTKVKVLCVNPEAPFEEYPNFTSDGFIIEFHFSENPYFSNRILYKYFKLKSEIDPNKPLKFCLPQPFSVEYSEIHWNPDQNVTIRQVKKTQRSRKTNDLRVVTKTENVVSFFNFFQTLGGIEMEKAKKRLGDDLNYEPVKLYEFDFLKFMDMDFIPKVALYYLGEIEEDNFSSEEEDDFYSDEDSDCEDKDEMKNVRGRNKKE